ncbi:MAG: hypothetical protein JWN21_322 [Sphingomonas bacterium]|uniref:DUF6894 family protein n=1 Tax=Sphingomonas bacterium TaxID=1895847 RepID=UPI0026227363|nr:hypothetical protein [Sphingomonas bacterium]MDB5694779.1 hypothetical protein [Sphingomonas bacterium]
MARFYFHSRDPDGEVLDPDGVECRDLGTVADYALRNARDVIAGGAQEGIIDLTVRIDVEDEAGCIVHSLAFGDAVTITA